ncbi:nucleolar transcription factor 1-like [Girardinichthys multiradiatus]|uniref:nucleolar transcription factor 1-like n=1 Tax=Girardinichthys multiradiatus TaxID=208333 RepID=UPI001FAB5ACE|nr:nucleolar transcription factor 1-like [Girardinichthys multiradiatus]
MDDVASATGWTTANMLKLIAAIRSSIPASQKTVFYRTGLSVVDWDQVAFPPFSPEECRQKWKSMMEKIRKLRSLPELIVEAEEAISDPPRHRKAIYQKEHALRLKECKRKMQDSCDKNDLPRIQTRGQKKKVPAIEDEDLPVKPPPNGLVLFMKELSNGDRLPMSLFKDMSQRWRNLSKAEKQNYSTRCKEMKREYNAKLLEYLHRFDEMEKPQIIKEKGIRLPKKPLKRTFCDEPKMPSQIGYVYFAKDQMKILKESISSRKKRIAKVKELWYKLPTKENERYKKQIHANMKQYSENLQKWFKTLTSEEQTEYLKHNPRKLQFLDARERMVVVEDQFLCQPSDSEDEDTVINNDKEIIWSSYEDENEEVEEGGNMFEMYS